LWYAVPFAFDRLVADSLPSRLANVEVDDVRCIVQALPP
jgi:hypothetical protein